MHSSRITELRKNYENVGDPLYLTHDLLIYLAVKTTWETSLGLLLFRIEELMRESVKKPVSYIMKM